MGAGQDGKPDKSGAMQEEARAPVEAQRGAAQMPSSPVPASGSMPTSAPTPTGTLGAEPTARGRLGTDPKPDEASARPPRLN
jgi:hypothetical protein